MLVVLVFVHVKADQIEQFQEVTLENARNSLQEPGIARFDLIQQVDDPAKFVIYEAYRDSEAPALHKETAHYLKWRDMVASMMETPRYSLKYQSEYPPDRDW